MPVRFHCLSCAINLLYYRFWFCCFIFRFFVVTQYNLVFGVFPVYIFLYQCDYCLYHQLISILFSISSLNQYSSYFTSYRASPFHLLQKYIMIFTNCSFANLTILLFFLQIFIVIISTNIFFASSISTILHCKILSWNLRIVYPLTSQFQLFCLQKSSILFTQFIISSISNLSKCFILLCAFSYSANNNYSGILFISLSLSAFLIIATFELSHFKKFLICFFRIIKFYIF